MKYKSYCKVVNFSGIGVSDIEEKFYLNIFKDFVDSDN